MKEVIALQEYTDKYVSFYEGEIRNITDDIADKLITKGIVRLHTDIPEDGGSGGGGGGDSIVVTHIDDNGVLGMTFSEVVSAVATGKLVLCIDKTSDDDYSYDVYYIMQTYPRGDDTVYYCVNLSSGDELSTDSLNGYPAYGE